MTNDLGQVLEELADAATRVRRDLCRLCGLRFESHGRPRHLFDSVQNVDHLKVRRDLVQLAPTLLAVLRDQLAAGRLDLEDARKISDALEGL